MTSHSASRIAYLEQTAAQKPHGSRSRYNAGCRCDACRESNRLYERARVRKRIFHGPARVDAAPVRAHIRALMAAGVGRHTISAVSGVHDRRISEIANGDRLECRAETAARIMEVTEADRAGGARVPAGPTIALIDELVCDGYTKKQIAEWLGYKTPAIQFRRTVITQERADAVLALFHKLRDGFIQRSDSHGPARGPDGTRASNKSGASDA